MHLNKFLLIDLALLLLGSLFLWKISIGTDESTISFEPKEKDKSSNAIAYMPTLQNLLDCERKARKLGDDICLDSLIGLWKFYSVWGKDSVNKNHFTNYLLRTFKASLELQKNNIPDSDFSLYLENSIHFDYPIYV